MKPEILVVLGGSDPEMTVVEALLTECGVRFMYATVDGQRVHPGNAYRADSLRVPETADGASDVTVYLVECAPTLLGLQHDDQYVGPVVHIDHHRPGDPGFGVGPEDFLRASSLGQVISMLAGLEILSESWRVPWEGHYCSDFAMHGQEHICTVGGSHEYVYQIPRQYVLTAAADHCLGHAYAGKCPGVDPDELMRWRVASRAVFQGRSEAGILADIAVAKLALESAQWIILGSASELLTPGFDGEETSEHWYDICARDMRGRHVPELPEAGTRYDIPYVAEGLSGPDGRRKVVCSGSADVIRAFLAWAPREGFIEAYGDPARGFAGAYYPTCQTD